MGRGQRARRPFKGHKSAGRAHIMQSPPLTCARAAPTPPSRSSETRSDWPNSPADLFDCCPCWRSLCAAREWRLAIREEGEDCRINCSKWARAQGASSNLAKTGLRGDLGAAAKLPVCSKAFLCSGERRILRLCKTRRFCAGGLIEPLCGRKRARALVRPSLSVRPSVCWCARLLARCACRPLGANY